jgi:hypothetical protein
LGTISDMGDIEGLAESIKQYGLMQPIVVDDDNNLVAGERRLVACKALDWGEIEVKSLGELTPRELCIIELEENIRRKDLTEYETSKVLVEYVEAVKETCSDSEQVSKPKSGPVRRPGSYRDIEDRTGIPIATISKAQTHVVTADAFPFMQPWAQYRVLEAKEYLGKLPEEE